MRSASLSPVSGRRTVRERGIVRALQRAQAALTRIDNLDEVLVAVLDCCSDAVGCLYPTIALLNEQGSQLVGRQISSQNTAATVRRLTEAARLPFDGFLGIRGERRAAHRGALNSTIPRDAICYSLASTENLVAQVFVERTLRVTTCLHDLVGPRVQAVDAATAQQALGIGSIALLPIAVAERCLGVLAVAIGAAHSFHDSDLPVLDLFACQAGMAIERARLLKDLRDREQQVSFLLKATIDAQEEERERICLEIHDGVAQTLGAAFQHLQTLDARPGLPDNLRSTLRKAAALVREATREAREVIASLRPAALDALGLVSTLRHETDELCSQTGWLVEFEASQVRFPKTVETALYRIVHEALSNVAKHAQAKQVAIRVKQEHGCIVAEVQDNGIGFDYLALERDVHQKGVGLLSMRKRAELLHGNFALVSGPGKGTRVRVEVPLLDDKDQEGGVKNGYHHRADRR